MRRVRRSGLPVKANQYLEKQQEKADLALGLGTLNVGKAWAAAIKSSSMGSVRRVLRQMANAGERCMYCVDSHGSDIEHFWPKTPFPQQMFRWTNLLLSCTECGRFKASQFPLQDGRPLLVDPSNENPWNHIDFDPVTGRLTARYCMDPEGYSPMGVETVKVLRLDREHLEGQYRKTYRRLCRVLAEFGQKPDGSARDLAQALQHADDHGLLGWWIEGSGADDPPLAEFENLDPELWGECAAILSNAR